MKHIFAALLLLGSTLMAGTWTISSSWSNRIIHSVYNYAEIDYQMDGTDSNCPSGYFFPGGYDGCRNCSLQTNVAPVGIETWLIPLYEELSAGNEQFQVSVVSCTVWHYQVG